MRSVSLTWSAASRNPTRPLEVCLERRLPWRYDESFATQFAVGRSVVTHPACVVRDSCSVWPAWGQVDLDHCVRRVPDLHNSVVLHASAVLSAANHPGLDRYGGGLELDRPRGSRGTCDGRDATLHDAPLTQAVGTRMPPWLQRRHGSIYGMSKRPTSSCWRRRSRQL